MCLSKVQHGVINIYARNFGVREAGLFFGQRLLDPQNRFPSFIQTWQDSTQVIQIRLPFGLVHCPNIQSPVDAIVSARRDTRGAYDAASVLSVALGEKNRLDE
jgi:hypothetical protein